MVAFVSAVSQRGTPLTAVQLLWINLIMDTLAAVALGTELPEEKLLLRQPYGRYDRLISALMWRDIFGQSLFQVRPTTNTSTLTHAHAHTPKHVHIRTSERRFAVM